MENSNMKGHWVGIFTSKGNIGKPEWGKYEILENGQWIDYELQ